MIAITFAPSLLETWIKDRPYLPGYLLAGICIAILLIRGLVRYYSRRADEGRPVLDPYQVEDLLSGIGALVVDLRDPAAYRAGHIRGSLPVPFNELPKRFTQPDPTAKRAMILVGTNDDMARKAYDLLAGRRFAMVYILKGGIRAWQKANLPLAK
ncbi:MAG TPA: rhodanese-like domain-containing protein [Geothrix sp.]|nr:rhodanese-like domain-containing protein [Geothrix sp.]